MTTTTPSTRVDSRDEPWPLRPWIMAGLCAVAGLAFWLLVETVDETRATSWRVVGASFVAVATLSFVMTVEKRRWLWALGFALAWGLIVGLVGWNTHGYNRGGEVVEFPFLAAIFAVLLACPLFQNARDEGGWRFSSGNVHTHVWTDAVIGAASILFIGIVFLLAWLIAGLFDVIGIDALKELLQEPEFGWPLAGFAFGAAVGILRERDALVGTMQRLVMVVLAVLSPVLAVALVLFLLSLPVSGLSGLWDSRASAAALTMAAAGGAWVLLNAAIGMGDEDQPSNRVLRWSALALSLVVLPLAGIAMTALMLRVGQYGWSPDRLWAVVCAGVAIAFGLAGWWSVWRGRGGFAPVVRTVQTRLALGGCGVALLLALPIIDFGAISARDQVARLRSGATAPGEFDWAAMAFDFGPEGRAALGRIVGNGPEGQRTKAREALAADGRWELTEYAVNVERAELRDEKPLVDRLRVLPVGRTLPAEAMAEIDTLDACRRGQCVAVWIDEDRIAVMGQEFAGQWANTRFVQRDSRGEWSERNRRRGAAEVEFGDLATARIEVKERVQRVITVNGREVEIIDDAPPP